MNLMESLLVDYPLLPFVMSPPALTNLFIPSLFGISPPPNPYHLINTAATATLAGTGVTSTVPPQHRKLFIGGLNHETSDEQLRDYYSCWGQVVDCIVIRDPVTRQSRGFGFVTFATPEMADAAMAERPHTIGGKIVDPKRAIPREQMLQTANCPPVFLEIESPSPCKLTLSGIHWDSHTVDILREHFERFGELEQVEIVGHPRGYGFVVFEERSSVIKCLAYGRTQTINGNKIEIREEERDCHHDGVLPSSPLPSILSPPLRSNRNKGGHSQPYNNNKQHQNSHTALAHPHRSRHQARGMGAGHGQSGGSLGSDGSQSHSPESMPSEAES